MRLASAVTLAVVVAAGTLAASPAKQFGKPLQGLPAVKLSDVLATPEAGRVVRLEGTIEKVCQNKGCWVTLRQGDQRVHVTFEGYSFFLPKDSAAAPGRAGRQGRGPGAEARPRRAPQGRGGRGGRGRPRLHRSQGGRGPVAVLP